MSSPLSPNILFGSFWSTISFFKKNINMHKNLVTGNEKYLNLNKKYKTYIEVFSCVIGPMLPSWFLSLEI